MLVYILLKYEEEEVIRYIQVTRGFNFFKIPRRDDVNLFLAHVREAYTLQFVDGLAKSSFAASLTPIYVC